MRLALARYQPCSAEGAHLSEVLLADVMLFGSGYGASGGSREVRPRSKIDPLSGQVNQVTPVSPKPVVDVWLEPTLGSDFGWVLIGAGWP